MNKVCRKCNRKLPLEQFVRNKSCRNGYSGTCLDCSNLYCTAWKRVNASRLNPIRRQQYAERYGPIQRAKEKNRQDNYPVRVRAQLLRGGMRERTKVLGLAFDSNILTLEYLMALIRDTPVCPCCGRELDYGFKHDKQKHDNSPSIDRIDIRAGYVVNNIALICWRCNNLKRDAGPNELQMIVDWMRSKGL